MQLLALLHWIGQRQVQVRERELGKNSVTQEEEEEKGAEQIETTEKGDEIGRRQLVGQSS